MTAEQSAALHAASLDELREIYANVWRDNDREIIRDFILNDRFFLLTQVLGVDVAFHPWVLERCREVEADPDEHLDLWSRGHFKSTIITFAGVAQFVLNNPDKCVCIISYKAGAAEAFAGQIKNAFESNEVLLDCFPDILWSEVPDHRGPQWSVSDFSVKRTTAKKECTVATSGLVSGMRTGGHYDLLVYDDTVTPDSVITPEMSQRTTDAWTMSLNLGSDGADGSERTKHWYIGTRYAIFDTYREMIERGIPERRHIAIDADGNPVYLSREALEQKQREMDAKTWASQILQVPIGSGELYFQPEWWRTYTDCNPDQMHRYMFVDTATKRGKRNDYSVYFVIGFNRDRNYYVLDLVRDKLTLSQRADTFLDLNDRWQVANTFWEANGSRSDAEYLRERMAREGVSYRITEIEQTAKYGSKEDRIRWLEPEFRDGRILFPSRLLYQPKNDETRLRDLVRDFYEEEYTIMPSVVHDDMLDCLANVKNPDINRMKLVTFPPGSEIESAKGDRRRASMGRPTCRFG